MDKQADNANAFLILLDSGKFWSITNGSSNGGSRIELTIGRHPYVTVWQRKGESFADLVMRCLDKAASIGGEQKGGA